MHSTRSQRISSTGPNSSKGIASSTSGSNSHGKARHWPPLKKTSTRRSYTPGFDTHGLPLELKALAALDKPASALLPQQIRSAARKEAEKGIKVQTGEFKTFAVMADWENPYRTMDWSYEKRQLEVVRDMVKQGTCNSRPGRLVRLLHIDNAYYWRLTSPPQVSSCPTTARRSTRLRLAPRSPKPNSSTAKTTPRVRCMFLSLSSISESKCSVYSSELESDWETMTRSGWRFGLRRPGRFRVMWYVSPRQRRATTHGRVPEPLSVYRR